MVQIQAVDKIPKYINLTEGHIEGIKYKKSNEVDNLSDLLLLKSGCQVMLNTDVNI